MTQPRPRAIAGSDKVQQQYGADDVGGVQRSRIAPDLQDFPADSFSMP